LKQGNKKLKLIMTANSYCVKGCTVVHRVRSE
jgi:hypothetical protein